MHDCKATKEMISDFLLDQTHPESTELLAGFRSCRECREELDVLKQTLLLTRTAINSAAPAEEFWSGYHATLKQNLSAARGQTVSKHPRASWFKQSLTRTVQVPLPVAVAALIVFSGLCVFALRASGPQNAAEPLIVEIPVEVPVITEKVVTRAVFRDRFRRSPSRKLVQENKRKVAILASSQSNDSVPPSLVGFKPLDEIKLTVIKGGRGNEK